MRTRKPQTSLASQQRQRALSRWENEGGAVCRRSGTIVTQRRGTVPLADAELVQLRIRVIALENLVIALLAQSPDRWLEVARDMATYISPRPGFTRHRLTVHAAAQMVHLVERAGFFRTSTSS